MTEYWFARRFPLGHGRAGMTPISWKGWLVVATFFAVLAIAIGVAIFMNATGRTIEGVEIFGIAMFVDFLWYGTTTRRRGDRIRTVSDYRKDKASV